MTTRYVVVDPSTYQVFFITNQEAPYDYDSENGYITVASDTAMMGWHYHTGTMTFARPYLDMVAMAESFRVNYCAQSIAIDGVASKVFDFYGTDHFMVIADKAQNEDPEETRYMMATDNSSVELTNAQVLEGKNKMADYVQAARDVYLTVYENIYNDVYDTVSDVQTSYSSIFSGITVPRAALDPIRTVLDQKQDI